MLVLLRSRKTRFQICFFNNLKRKSTSTHIYTFNKTRANVVITFNT